MTLANYNISTMTEEEKEKQTRLGQEINNRYHVYNVYDYLAFLIVYDSTDFGLNGHFVGHDGVIGERGGELIGQPIRILSLFLEERGIDTISKVVKYKEEISNFFIKHIMDDWGIKDP